VAMEQIYNGQSITVTDLQRSKWHWDRVVVDRIPLR